jgi:hypothetical protein
LDVSVEPPRVRNENEKQTLRVLFRTATPLVAIEPPASPRGALPIVVYELYGHYSFNPRDGGQAVKVLLSEGYSVAAWLNGARLIVGTRVAVSIEQAIHHGFARIVA